MCHRSGHWSSSFHSINKFFLKKNIIVSPICLKPFEFDYIIGTDWTEWSASTCARLRADKISFPFRFGKFLNVSFFHSLSHFDYQNRLKIDTLNPFWTDNFKWLPTTFTLRRIARIFFYYFLLLLLFRRSSHVVNIVHSFNGFTHIISNSTTFDGLFYGLIR